MKKYLWGLAGIALCVACAVWVSKGCSSDVSEGTTQQGGGQVPINAKKKQMTTVSVMPSTIVVSNGVMVVDTREKIPPRSPDYEPYMRERQKAFTEGADAKVTLHVVDQAGKDVEAADVSINFCLHSKNKPIEGKTNIKGCFTAEGRLAEEIIYSVNKKGYYETYTKFWIMDTYRRCLQDGRWIPWNPTLEVTLKEIRKPIPMVAKKMESKFPKNVQSIGFDFLVGDWVVPHGKGITVDMLYVYEEERTDKANYDLTRSLIFPGTGNGCYMKKKEEYCTLMSDHEARLDNYSSNSVLRIVRKDGNYVVRETRISEDDYLIFRARSQYDEKGNMISAHYGKIYGPVGVPGSINQIVSFTYYFNPTPNDRSLEFDGKNNLLKDLESLEEVNTP